MSTINVTQQIKGQSKNAIFSSYLKRINNIFNTSYDQLFLYIIKANSSSTKKTKITKELRLKQTKEPNWMIIYRYLILKKKHSIGIPTLCYKYLYHRSKSELKFLYEEAKKNNFPYSDYIDVYIAKFKHHLKKIREKKLQEQLEDQVEYNQYGFRKIKTSKNIKYLPDGNSDEDQMNDKKGVVTQQMNKLKKESKLEMEEILQNGQLNWIDKYKHVKSKYLIDRNKPLTYHQSLMCTSIQSPKYSSSPITISNKYQSTIAETKSNKEKSQNKTKLIKVNRLPNEIDSENKKKFLRERKNMLTMFTSGDFYYI